MKASFFLLAGLVLGTAPLSSQTSGRNMASNSPLSSTLAVTAGKSIVVSSDVPIDRVAVGLGEIAEATAISPTDVLLNGKTSGSTSLILFQQGGGRLFFDVNVAPNSYIADSRLENTRREINHELPGQNIELSSKDDIIYLRGTARDLASAQRAALIASYAGRVVNLMYVPVPPPEAQILLKVRFASLDRNKSLALGLNLFSAGGNTTIGSTSTQQFPSPTLPTSPQPQNTANPFVFSDILNLFVYQKNLNLGATIRDLETQGIMQSLAEPNMIAQNGKQASFLAGGEYPYPVFQGSAGGTGAITIQFREFGIRLNFIPTITPRGTVQLQVAPEVSALDFTNGITIQGFTIPSLTSRKVKTEVELSEGQSFAIGGLLDRTVTENLSKMPFIGDIPVLGKLFQSKNVSRANTELIVIVTPELVRPIPAGIAPPEIDYPVPFLKADSKTVRTPGLAVTGPVPVTPPQNLIAVETLLQSMQPEQPLNTGSTTSVFANNPPGPGAAASATAATTGTTSTTGAAVQHP